MWIHALACAASALAADLTLSPTEQLARFAFGSCNQQRTAQPHWDKIADADPQLWVWLGDVIYADKLDDDQRKTHYKKLKAEPGYQRLISKAKVIGTWDDHDYCANNKGEECEDRRTKQKLFQDFIGIPAEHPIRDRKGVYHSTLWGPKGKQVLFLMLDLRYHKSKKDSIRGFLGKKQWDWLKSALATEPGELVVIGSSLQMVSERHKGEDDKERWAAYPKAREELYTELRKHNRRYLVISGDIHRGEFSRIELSPGAPLLDATSSGLTHTTDKVTENPNRVGPMVHQLHYGWVGIDWSGPAPKATIELRSTVDSAVLHKIEM